VSKTDDDIRLYIDAFVSGLDWHGHIVGPLELAITKNKLDVIKNVSPQRSGRAYLECHLGLTPVAVPIMSREAAPAVPQEQDNVERSMVRSAADVAKSKLKPPFFPKTKDELMGWLANWQLVLFMKYGPLYLEYEQARALAHEIQGNMDHYMESISARMCHYVIWSVFTSARYFFKKIWNPTRPNDLPTSSLTAVLGFSRHGKFSEPIGCSRRCQPMVDPRSRMCMLSQPSKITCST
jgi:hypothetical protein